MDPIIEEEIIKKHNEADAFISLFFAGLDAVCYIIILVLFGVDFKGISSPKQKLSLLIVIDAVLRIINMYTDEFSKYFIKELFFTLFSTIQFSIIISILNHIFSNKGNELYDSDLEIKYQTVLSITFFVLCFSFKGILFFYKYISLIQFFCTIVGIYIMNRIIGGKLEIYLSNVSKKDSSFSGENFINNMPFFISIYLIIDYCFEIVSLLIENKLYASYMIMVCKTFKEVGKYLVLLLVITVCHTFNKYYLEEDSYSSTEIRGHESEKTKVNIYKDEDEIDDV
jgi:hypothetical protein